MEVESINPVVCGVDDSPESMAAVELAADEAAARVSPLVVVHATTRPSGQGDAEARHLLAVAVGRARAEHPCLAVSGELAEGDPVDALVSRSGTASLVVVGHRGHGGVAGLGSVAATVARRADAPVIVHRPLVEPPPETPWPREEPPVFAWPRRHGPETSWPQRRPASAVRPVLVGVDASVAAEPVIGFAFAEAALRGAPLTALHVWTRPDGSDPAGIHPETYDFTRSRDEAQRMLAEALAGWSGKYPDVAVDSDVRHSLDRTRVLLDASRLAQLVVVGGSRLGGLARLLLGSVSQSLVEHAGCPVAVVPRW